VQNSTRLGLAAIFGFVAALDLLDRYRLAPNGLAESVLVVVAVTMVVAAATRTDLWHRIELVVVWIVVGLGLVYNVLNLCSVVDKLVFQAVEPSKLFFTALAIWINNVLIFALLYWLIDKSGTLARRRVHGYPDFDFPAFDAGDKVPPDWRPGLVDYLFLGFTTATAFSPTEAQPLTARAKLLMILQSAISLTTVAVVAARAINVIQ
jgi:uncharacterized membrane protein